MLEYYTITGDSSDFDIFYTNFSLLLRMHQVPIVSFQVINYSVSLQVCLKLFRTALMVRFFALLFSASVETARRYGLSS